MRGVGRRGTLGPITAATGEVEMPVCAYDGGPITENEPTADTKRGASGNARAYDGGGRRSEKEGAYEGGPANVKGGFLAGSPPLLLPQAFHWPGLNAQKMSAFNGSHPAQSPQGFLSAQKILKYFGCCFRATFRRGF